jgi:hypothetical protein
MSALRAEGFYYEAGVYWAPSIDPNERLDYKLDFTDALGADTIATVVWTVGTGLTKHTESNDNTSATIWLKDGVLGSTVTVTCKITTAGNRVFERSFKIKVADQ